MLVVCMHTANIGRASIRKVVSFGVQTLGHTQHTHIAVKAVYQL